MLWSTKCPKFSPRLRRGISLSISSSNTRCVCSRPATLLFYCVQWESALKNTPLFLRILKLLMPRLIKYTEADSKRKLLCTSGARIWSYSVLEISTRVFLVIRAWSSAFTNSHLSHRFSTFLVQVKTSFRETVAGTSENRCTSKNFRTNYTNLMQLIFGKFHLSSPFLSFFTWDSRNSWLI